MRVIIAGGGTGGHLFPGVAVAQELLAQNPETQLLFVGTARGIEARVVPELGYELALIKVRGVKTGKIWARIAGLFSVPRAMWQSWRILRKFKPDVVLGVGGYASGPCVLMAWMTRRPTAVLEQNSIPGFTNKVLGKVCRRVFIAFDRARSFFKAKKTQLVGNPVRPEIIALADAPRTTPGRRLFVFGGSLGAQAINKAVVEAAPKLLALEPAFELFHQTGKADYETTKQAYVNAGLDELPCHAFVTDMAARYQWCDIIVARAGATSVAELALVGKPAILIPYPHAADDHQTYNAAELADAGAAIVIKQSELTAKRLIEVLQKVSEPDTYQRMAAAMREKAKPNAAKDVVLWCESQAR